MPPPRFPEPAPGDVLLISTCYEDGAARWGGLLDRIDARREDDVLVLQPGGVRLRPAEDRRWDHLHGGNVPALLPPTGLRPPVAVLADLPAAYGDGPLLVDLAALPGRGVRVAPARLGEVLAAVLDGTLAFDDLVRAMDRYGMYQGDGGRPAFPTPTTAVPHRSFPPLPATAAALLVRTCFDDEEGWRALLDDLGGADEDGWVGADLDPDEIDIEHYPLEALVVDDRAFEGLRPGQVPVLVPPGEHTTLVALADARTFTEPGRPLTVVDLYDTPGRSTVLPCREVGSMACNLEIGNMDFHEFIAVQGTQPWWAE
ncbi:hypothetical protein [Streptomyces sp. NPDC046727]|uniref:DUF6924 domain-containing protein n=1 Tax=Streptomyces sp. NPDC046727 TaxID=3155373 RepID=UPI0033D05847